MTATVPTTARYGGALLPEDCFRALVATIATTLELHPRHATVRLEQALASVATAAEVRGVHRPSAVVDVVLRILMTSRFFGMVTDRLEVLVKREPAPGTGTRADVDDMADAMKERRFTPQRDLWHKQEPADYVLTMDHVRVGRRPRSTVGTT